MQLSICGRVIPRRLAFFLGDAKTTMFAESTAKAWISRSVGGLLEGGVGLAMEWNITY
jgi:hypothetical protein